MDESSLRSQLVDSYKLTSALGLNEASTGNLSCRYGSGMLISPSGANAENITAEALVFVEFDGTHCSDIPPSTEWQMHAAIYQAHDSANAVVHTHSDHCVALASHNQPLPGFHYMVGFFGGTDVPCVPYATFGTETLGRSAAAALNERNACLLGSHGMICRGHDLAGAVKLAQQLESLCRQYLLARQLGEPKLLSNEEWEDFFARAESTVYQPKNI